MSYFLFRFKFVMKTLRIWLCRWQSLSARGILLYDLKGISALGSLVEICVKQTKFLIYKSINTVILEYFQFELLIAKAVSLTNKRPKSSVHIN